MVTMLAQTRADLERCDRKQDRAHWVERLKRLESRHDPAVYLYISQRRSSFRAQAEVMQPR